MGVGGGGWVGACDLCGIEMLVRLSVFDVLFVCAMFKWCINILLIDLIAI